MKKLMALLFVATATAAVCLLADSNDVVTMDPWTPKMGMQRFLTHHPPPGERATMSKHLNPKQGARFVGWFTNRLNTATMPTGTVESIIIQRSDTNGAYDVMATWILDQ
jgi:uncharacterized repeat protein (TIGR02543 family)